MIRCGLNIKLLIALLIILAGTIFIEFYYKKASELPYAKSMRDAAQQAQEWFNIIKEIKKEKGIDSEVKSNIPNAFMLGDEWSEITTTLGSIESKETSTNPDFAALVVRWLHEANITKNDKVGVILSGSFPSVSISVLAALQTMEIDAIIISSLGASTYGANQVGATWIDMEQWLIKYGGLKYRSSIVSMGAGQDTGNGLTEEGLIALNLSAKRNQTTLYIPSTIVESIDYKTNYFLSNNISLLINIGGNMSSLGSCNHALNIPNGINYSLKTCSDANRGVIAKISEKGIPFIHFLDIKDIAIKYGIDIVPGNHYAGSFNLYTEKRQGKAVPVIVLCCCLIPVIFIRSNLNR